MAVFSAADEGLFYAVPLAVPVKDRLVLDEEPYLVPLLEAAHRQRQYLVVVTGSHRGRLYEAAWRHTRVLKEIEEEVPSRQRSTGESRGNQQAAIARHREDHLPNHSKRLVAAVERAWRHAPYRGLVLLGEVETLGAVRAKLPTFLADRVVHVAPYQWTRGDSDLDAVVQDVLEDAVRTHGARLVDEIDRRLREHYPRAARRR
jgi:protein required for attachment to host cells